MTDELRRPDSIAPAPALEQIRRPNRWDMGKPMEATITRRHCLGRIGRAGMATTLLPGLLASCAQPITRLSLDSNDRLVELDSGRDITRAELMRQMAGSRFLLLGELHDNTWHHRRRAALLQELAGMARPAVVAEHLTRSRQASREGELLPALQAAGFDPQGWQWPLHQPLFDALRQANLPLQGGNLPAELARRIAREGAGAVPTDLAELLARTEPDDPSRSSRESDLRSSADGR